MKMKTEKLTVFAPATIANLSCGFDVLGLALDGIGDILHLELTPEPGVSITRVTGADIPLETDRNVAGIAGMAFLEAATGYSGGVRIEIEKRIAPGSGIGSSAASSG